MQSFIALIQICLPGTVLIMCPSTALIQIYLLIVMCPSIVLFQIYLLIMCPSIALIWIYLLLMCPSIFWEIVKVYDCISECIIICWRCWICVYIYILCKYNILFRCVTFCIYNTLLINYYDVMLCCRFSCNCILNYYYYTHTNEA